MRSSIKQPAGITRQALQLNQLNYRLAGLLGIILYGREGLIKFQLPSKQFLPMSIQDHFSLWNTVQRYIQLGLEEERN